MKHLLANLALVGCLAAEDAPPTPESIDAAITRGVDFLVATQKKNGAWGGPTRTKGLNIYAPIPGAHHAFQSGCSALALAGLLDSGDTRPETLEAIRKGGEWLSEILPRLRRADQTTTYNVWGHAYGLRALTRLHRTAATEEEKTKWAKLAQQQVDLLNRYEDVNGGWGYLDLDDAMTQRPSGIPTAFTTATALLAMHEAREEMGVELDEKIIQHCLASIVRQRTPDFAYVYSHDHRMRPRIDINRPAGSLSRSQVCNAALRIFGDEKITDEVLETWATRFVDREGFLSIGRKRPVPHETHFKISGYFYYYGVYYFAEAVRLLPGERQSHHAARLAPVVMGYQEKDGSWWDYPLYDYHQPYGTGYALSALAWCRDSLSQ